MAAAKIHKPSAAEDALLTRAFDEHIQVVMGRLSDALGRVDDPFLRQAEVLVAKDQHQLLVQYESLFDEASAQPLKEWCHPELLRPVPPRPPADWASHLVAGQALDLSHDDGWWEVRRRV